MSPSPRVILASDDFALQTRIAGGVEGFATLTCVSPNAADLLRSLVEAKPALLLVELSDRTPLHTIVALVRRADPLVATVALGDATCADTVLAAVRAGAADFLALDSAPDVFRAQIQRHLRIDDDGHRATPGTFEMVLAPMAGGGENLFAINLAAMKARAGEEMLLVDCALPGTEAGAALDLKFGYTIQDAIKDMGRLDRTLVTSALTRHEETGLMVLPLATEAAPDVDGVAPEVLARLVGVVRPLFRHTLLNAGGVRSPGLLLEFMQAATRIYVVCPQKFTAVAEAQRLLERVGPSADVFRRMVLLVDEHQSAISLTEDQMRQTLGMPVSFRLPPARVELINGLNTGRPYALDHSRSPYAQALAKLCDADLRGPVSGPAKLINQAFSEARRRIGAGRAA